MISIKAWAEAKGGVTLNHEGTNYGPESIKSYLEPRDQIEAVLSSLVIQSSGSPSTTLRGPVQVDKLKPNFNLQDL